MSSPSRPVQPPRIASWLVNLFAASHESECLLGDMFEEFVQISSHRGPAVAKRWYWQQTRRSIAHLFARAFRANPWLTGASVLTGLLLNRFVWLLPMHAILATVHRYQLFERHFNLYVFFTTDGIVLGHILSSLLIGLVIALLARGREMVTTTSLAIVLCTMTLAGIIGALSTGHTFIFSALPASFADWLALVVGGVVVRIHRSAAGNRFSAA